MNISFLLILGLTMLSRGVNGLNRTLKVMGVGSLPYLSLADFKDGLPTGAEMDILNILAQRFNYTLAFQATNAWGRRLDNGSWTGTIGKVVSGDADVGVGHIAVTSDRSQWVDYSHFLDTQHVYIHSRKPFPLPPHFNLTKPFAIEVWLLFLASLLILTLVLALTTSNSDFVSFKGSFLRSIDIYIELLATNLSQSRPLHFLTKRSFKPFLFSWLVFVSLMNMFYDCNFRAYLTSVDFEDEVNTLDDCLRLNRKLHLLQGAVITQILMNLDHPAMKILVREAVDNNRYFSFKTELPLSLDKKMMYEDAVCCLADMFHWNRLHILQRRFGSIPIRIGTQSLFFVFSALAFPKHSQIYHQFNRPILYLIDCGIVRKLIDKHQLEDMERIVPDPDAPLGLEHLLLALILYCVMIVFSAVFLGYEIKRAGGMKQRRSVKKR